MITQSFIIGLLGKIILTIELSSAQFLWNIAINQGMVSSKDYLFWMMFNGKILSINKYEIDAFPIIGSLMGAASGIALIRDRNNRAGQILYEMALSIVIMLLAGYFIRMFNSALYIAVKDFKQYNPDLSYYFSDMYIINTVAKFNNSNNGIALLFFSSIYTISGLETSLFLMLRIGILISFYFFLPVSSFLIVFHNGREILFKLWILYLETSSFPVIAIPVLYIYINLSAYPFAQLGMLIFLTVIPALFTMGIYRTAISNFSSIPFLISLFGTENTFGKLKNIPVEIQKRNEKENRDRIETFPETNLERYLRSG